MEFAGLARKPRRRIRRLRRFGRNTYGRRHRFAYRHNLPRRAHRQVRARRKRQSNKGKRNSGPQYDHRRAGRTHTLVRLVRLQQRRRNGRGPARKNFRHHHNRSLGCIARGNDLHLDSQQKARPRDEYERLARRPRRCDGRLL